MGTNFYSVLINGVVARDGQILISRRSLEEEHEPGRWTIPGGKVEDLPGNDLEIGIIERTLAKEIREEVGVEITSNIHLLTNNTFRHTKGHMVLALVFLCEYQSGTAQALEDTSDVAWISSSEIGNYDFSSCVHDYIAKGFAFLPFMHKPKKSKQN